MRPRRLVVVLTFLVQLRLVLRRLVRLVDLRQLIVDRQLDRVGVIWAFPQIQLGQRQQSARAPELMTADQIAVGIIGGSGFYELFDDAREVTVETPYGAPSAPVVVGAIGGRTVGFLPRHGRRHELPPHRINYRANLWALSELGATDVILPCAAGSLQSDVMPGHFVIADQLVDRTRNRVDTFYDGPRTTHISFADPYDEELRQVAVATARELDIPVHDRGTVVVIEGPRFSTRAESRSYSAMGWEVINMTQYPEAVLARELQMAAVNISLITDYDAGHEDDPSVPPVSKDAVVEVFAANNARLRDLLFAMVPRLPLSPDRPALRALEGAQF